MRAMSAPPRRPRMTAAKGSCSYTYGAPRAPAEADYHYSEYDEPGELLDGDEASPSGGSSCSDKLAPLDARATSPSF